METKDRIVAGAEELFLNTGIKSVTMDDIARNLGMSKKTIYQFYKDKNEIVVELVRRKLDEDERQVRDLLEKSGNVIEELINMMKCSEEIFGRINPIVIHDMQKYHPDAWALFQQFKSVFLINMLEMLLTKGKHQGYIRNDLDVRILSRMRVNQVEMGFNTQVFPVAEFNPWKVQYQFLEHFCFGVCTLEGYKLLDKYKNTINE